MKKFKNILLALLVILLTQSTAFAQNPSDFGGDDQDENPTDKPQEPPVPIDTNLWVLLLVGSIYGCWKCKKRTAPN